MNDWKNDITKALEAAKSIVFSFAASTDDYRRFDGAIEILGAQIEGNEELDEEALPYLRVRSLSGEVFYAECEELRSDEAGAVVSLTEAVARPFALAREGGYASPADLIEHGTDQDRSSFLSDIKSQKRPSFWSSPAN